MVDVYFILDQKCSLIEILIFLFYSHKKWYFIICLELVRRFMREFCENFARKKYISEYTFCASNMIGARI